MPNQRAAGTAMMMIPLPKALKEELKKMARAEAMPLATFVRSRLADHAARSKAVAKAIAKKKISTPV